MAMSLDAIATLYAARPLRRLFGLSGRGGTPVLMYHSISDSAQDGRHPYFDLCTPPASFGAQVRALRERSFRSVPLTEARGAPRGSVAITFDDGYSDNLTAAWPVLKEDGFTATIFLVTDAVGGSFKGRPCLAWDDVRAMAREGAQFGSHTASHPELVRLGDAEIENECKISKQRLEDELHARVDLFSYPFAFPEADARFVARLRAILARLGYACGVTTILGTVRPDDDPFFLKRLPVSGHDDRALFEAKIEGAYDWMHGPQYLFKKARGLARRA
jgi:peptidoglycan/xylan/chitin deacetylase (PgdA/CDA1 family)